jgi:hypothetical protein
MEEFPSLPIHTKKPTGSKRSCSPCSSVSTTSIGAVNEDVGKVQCGDYFLTETATVRPFFKCRCRECLNSIPIKGGWENVCEKSFTASRGVTVQVTDSKVLKVRYYVDEEDKYYWSKYAVAMIRIESDSIARRHRRSGWVLTSVLRRRFSTSQSLLRAPARQVFVDRSRSPSMAPESMFEFGDLVEVRTDTSGKWFRGEVKQENPLLILVEGASRAERFHSTAVRPCVSARQFVATEDLAVRKQKQVDNWNTQILKKGTTVSVVYMDGYEGRIVSPVQGWISMRTLHSVNVVETGFTCAPQKPTIIVKNLPGDITISELKRNLIYRGMVTPETVEMQSRGDEFRALVTLSCNRKTAAALVDKKFVSIGNESDGKRATVCWDMRYLKNRAAWKLQTRK